MTDPAPHEPTDFIETPESTSPQLGATKAGPAHTGGMGVVAATIPSLSVPWQDLVADMRLHRAVRIEYNAKPVPALGGIPLIAKISQGGMGAVYYGVHPRLGKEVAVKVLHDHLAEQNSEMIERFCAEARLAARIQSQHLVSVLDVNQENGIYYFVMEFVRGPTAQSHLDQARKSTQTISEAVALEICIAACNGLAAAHAEGVIHRDVKPGNILIPRSRDLKSLRFGDAKLADLGLARSDELQQGRTSTGVCMGTPGYMAPEQAVDLKNCGKPADVFAMGATLYTLLAGTQPFKGLVYSEPESVRKTRTDVTPQTSALIEQCLDKSPHNRHADASALLEALSACRAALGRTPSAAALPAVAVEPPVRASKTTPVIEDAGFRAETQRFEMRQALFIAIPEAKEARERHDWKQVVELLEPLCADPSNADHPSRKIADTLLAKARGELTRRGGASMPPAFSSPSLDRSTPLPSRSADVLGKQGALAETTPTPASIPAPLGEHVLKLPGGVPLILKLLPAGSFLMGSPDNEQGRARDEALHRVTIGKPFYVAQFAVTQEQYEAVTGENPSQFRGGALPVEGVAWVDAAKFCELVLPFAPHAVKLPTEAQWEYACRAGSRTPFHFGTTIGTDLANYDGTYAYGFGAVGHNRKKTTFAGTFKPNAFGLYDMHGNVWEWCQDYYNEMWYRNSPELDPTGPSAGKAHVLRGGSWLNPPADCRSANRGRLVPNYRGANVGFRIVMASE
ncbi:MAG TPA: bifunctional serine/threonine-protein kinase/formylglycine-generating enzyme family protein [Planctomycetota bacterium]|nr:bifunctional serine/threonine-protein kinase/formylglycine-generating enzyme family protein [Planctomycetota bacterium]